MKCKKCGSNMESGLLFCPYCGTKLEIFNGETSEKDEIRNLITNLLKDEKEYLPLAKKFKFCEKIVVDDFEINISERETEYFIEIAVYFSSCIDDKLIKKTNSDASKINKIYGPIVDKQMQVVQDNVGKVVAMYMGSIRPWSKPLQFATISSARIAQIG